MTITRTPPSHPPSNRHRSARRIMRRIVGAAAVVMMVAASVSYAQALLAPGYAPWQDKTSSWLRDHGAAPLVNWYENWLYTRYPPSNAQPDLSPFTPDASRGATSPHLALPVLPGPADVPQPAWAPGRTGTGGAPLSYTAVFQPDPDHRSVVAGVALIPARGVSAHLVAGTQEPTDSASPADAQVPAADVRALVAVFNSGFKLKDFDGGLYRNGTMVRPLVDGQASAIIDDTGRLTIGQWGRDAAMNDHLVAVRQNLALIVDHGTPDPGLEANGNHQWGSTKNQLQYTSRSGLGTTAAGDLVYVAGTNMTLTVLAQALTDAGAQEAMELDIHSGMTFCSTWAVDPAGVLSPTKLLPTMDGPADRYLAPDRRDFFYLTANPAPADTLTRRRGDDPTSLAGAETPDTAAVPGR